MPSGFAVKRPVAVTVPPPPPLNIYKSQQKENPHKFHSLVCLEVLALPKSEVMCVGPYVRLLSLHIL